MRFLAAFRPPPPPPSIPPRRDGSPAARQEDRITSRSTTWTASSGFPRLLPSQTSPPCPRVTPHTQGSAEATHIIVSSVSLIALINDDLTLPAQCAQAPISARHILPTVPAQLGRLPSRWLRRGSLSLEARAHAGPRKYCARKRRGRQNGHGLVPRRGMDDLPLPRRFPRRHRHIMEVSECGRRSHARFRPTPAVAPS